jgi:UDP-glucose 4-epimerase
MSDLGRLAGVKTGAYRPDMNVDFPGFRRAFVTGCAGFIGSNMADRLLAAGVKVVGYDDLSTGMVEFLATAQRNSGFTFARGDVLDERALRQAMAGADVVFHFAANADVRFGFEHPRKDLDQNTIATFNVLEAMRANGVKDIVFASTGSIYGEADIVPTPEDAPFPLQTSLYGASKLAGEGLISAYCEGFGMRSWIFRFVSILGERYTHGHVFDFYKQLRVDPACCASSATATSANPISTSRTASMRCSAPSSMLETR